MVANDELESAGCECFSHSSVGHGALIFPRAQVASTKTSGRLVGGSALR